MCTPSVKCRRLASAVPLLLLLGAVAARASVQDGVLHYAGRAQDVKSGDLLYGEQHYVRFAAGRPAERVVLYTCPGGAAFARKQVRYVDAFAPDFELIDVAQGQHAGLRSTPAEREVFYREKAGAREIREPVTGRSGWVADAGFDEFVRAHWDRLMRGESLPLSFLIPSRGDLHDFQVKRQRTDLVDGMRVQVIRLRLSGWLGMLLPHIDAWYSDPQRELLRYEGLSNLMNRAGDHYKVSIAFPPAERRPADAGALAAALAVPLRGCG